LSGQRLRLWPLANFHRSARAIHRQLDHARQLDELLRPQRVARLAPFGDENLYDRGTLSCQEQWVPRNMNATWSAQKRKPRTLGLLSKGTTAAVRWACRINHHSPRDKSEPGPEGRTPEAGKNPRGTGVKFLGCSPDTARSRFVF